MIANEDLSSVLDSVNARWLQPHQVAKGFVPPPLQFSALLRSNNSLIVGPRGSGKTTLLKMLQGEALETWPHADAPETRRRVDYTGVFVPADPAWQGQLRALDRRAGESVPDFALSDAAFTTHVLHALVEAMDYRAHGPDLPSSKLHRRVSLSRTEEAEIVNSLMGPWHVDALLPTFRELKHALTRRLLSLHSIGGSELGAFPRRRGRVVLPSYVGLDFMAASALGVEVFDDVCGQGTGTWAFLFDELELAPAELRRRLLTSIRVANPRFLLKLSIAPFFSEIAEIRQTASPQPGHDFDLISLSYPRKEDSYRFSRSLFHAVLARRGVVAASVEDVVGTSIFDTPPEESKEFGTAYARGSRLQLRFLELFRSDATFRSYLENRRIDVTRLEDCSSDERASDIRKVTSVVAVRNAFRRPDNADPRDRSARRSRKNPDIYTGATAIFAIAEGNPRWLISIALSIADAYNLRAESHRRVGAAVQGPEIEKATARFLAFLRTLTPIDPVSLDSPIVTDLVDDIGTYFGERLVDGPFESEPPLTFTVDDGASEGTLLAIGAALNAGAFIRVDDEDSPGGFGDILHRSFRLSYILAPKYRLPITLGRPLMLSTILAGWGPGRGRRVPPGQLAFENDEALP